MLRPLSVAAVVLALMLPACAPGLDSPEARRTSAHNDTFLPYTEISSARFKIYAGRDILAFQLHARRDRKSGALTTHAQVLVGYHEKLGRRYETVRNDRAEALAMRQLQHDGSGCRRDEGCQHVEQFLIDVPEAQLRAAIQTGYRFKMFGRAGSESLFMVPAVAIQSLFQAVDGGAPRPVTAAKEAG